MKEEGPRTFFKGMEVIIPKNLKFTKTKYSVNGPMRLMIGKTKKIDEIYDGGNFSAGGWSWDQRDFRTMKRKKKIPIAHFNPEELVT